ncbi:hypothetical protein OIDMADRAFT_20959 [Oidiodendron maius Zn]|uniref:Uncharacterized protein n=1 Tax=Oidiodendron maius (strain Zn) TaxID=913774 RepID=A0A0C3H0Q2_OIDMZ|nr:hypothetical protein OIDMADRAFT_20959 [Oidiodendron maius Zn]
MGEQGAGNLQRTLYKSHIIPIIQAELQPPPLPLHNSAMSTSKSHPMYFGLVRPSKGAAHSSPPSGKGGKSGSRPCEISELWANCNFRHSLSDDAFWCGEMVW